MMANYYSCSIGMKKQAISTQQDALNAIFRKLGSSSSMIVEIKKRSGYMEFMPNDSRRTQGQNTTTVVSGDNTPYGTFCFHEGD